MSSDYCLEANNWQGEPEDDRDLDDTDVLTEEQIEAILDAEYPESDWNSPEEIAAMEAEWLARHAA